MVFYLQVTNDYRIGNHLSIGVACTVMKVIKDVNLEEILFTIFFLISNDSLFKK